MPKCIGAEISVRFSIHSVVHRSCLINWCNRTWCTICMTLRCIHTSSEPFIIIWSNPVANSTLQGCPGCLGIEEVLLSENASRARRPHWEASQLCSTWEVIQKLGAVKKFQGMVKGVNILFSYIRYRSIEDLVLLARDIVAGWIVLTLWRVIVCSSLRAVRSGRN
jgi:hypothetical protein